MLLSVLWRRPVFVVCTCTHIDSLVLFTLNKYILAFSVIGINVHAGPSTCPNVCENTRLATTCRCHWCGDAVLRQSPLRRLSNWSCHHYLHFLAFRLWKIIIKTWEIYMFRYSLGHWSVSMCACLCVFTLFTRCSMYLCRVLAYSYCFGSILFGRLFFRTIL